MSCSTQRLSHTKGEAFKKLAGYQASLERYKKRVPGGIPLTQRVYFYMYVARASYIIHHMTGINILILIKVNGSILKQHRISYDFLFFMVESSVVKRRLRCWEQKKTNKKTLKLLKQCNFLYIDALHVVLYV